MKPETLGKQLFNKIDGTIHGHLCMYEEEAGALAKSIFLAGAGDHLEIGSMWGGTAILAALVKREFGLPGKVYCIDPLKDGDCSPNFPHEKPNADIFLDNLKIMGVEDMVNLHIGFSDPFPYGHMHFASCLIDGDHYAPWPMHDWEVTSAVCDMVIIHDLYPHEQDVMALAGHIRSLPNWKELKQVGSLATFTRAK